MDERKKAKVIKAKVIKAKLIMAKVIKAKVVMDKVKECMRKLRSSMDKFPRKVRSNFIRPLIFFLSFIIYLEVALHVLTFQSIDAKIIYPILLAIPIGVLVTLLTGFFSNRVNKILMWILTSGLCLLFCIQLVYFDIFKIFFSFQSLGMAGDAISEFNSEIFTAIKANLLGLFLLLLPLLVFAIVLRYHIDCNKRSFKMQRRLLFFAVALHVLVLCTLLFYGKGDYTPYDLYHNTKVPDLCAKQLGIITMTRFDIAKAILGDEKLVLAYTPVIQLDIEPTIAPILIPQITTTPKPAEPNATPTPTPLPTPIPIDTSPNVMNIDFNALAEAEPDATIKTLHEYFANVPATNKNEYTGMFEGYNLIMITAEGFSPYAVDEVVTPTLYKLTHEGFVFNNFYTALWQTSTSDGEYVACTGLIPVGTRSMYHARNNLLPFSLGNQFNQLGVESKAYHNHTYTYYERNETHPNMGYIFKANGNGLVLEHPDVWPESDLEMINATVDEYINEDQFHVYYLTVSGHMNYTFVGNQMANWNKAAVKDLPYSSDCKAYIACQKELDKALEQLIKDLEEAGVADKTVIALSADHYPYGWEKKNIDEIAGHIVDPDFEIYKNHFILWSAGMKENIVVDKPCSSLDILPTLSNLFGIEYDSRLLMGQDIFSDSDPLVILSNRSFITDKVMYNTETGEAEKLTKEELPENYIETLNKIIKNKFSVSQSIAKQDYYRYVFPDYVD